MALIKPSCVRDLRTRVNVVDVISRAVTLRKAGSRYKGLCPFHQEKSPSFHVNPDMGVYKCFGCGKSGDLITFVRETEGLNFVEAVETLAQRFNFPLEYEEGRGPSREERSLRQELFDLHEVAAEHFHQVFKMPGPTGDFMRRYWVESRRFSPELADEFKIGATEATDHTLAAVLLKRRFSEDALRQCGLFFMRDGALPALGSLRPRFRGRLMIPIRDHQGRVVAFTARQTDLTPADDPAREAKYVNSPETPIFTKGHLLFNLDRARKAAGDGHPFVLVEGQLDALRAWSVGVKTAVAPQGTSITDGQLALLRRYHDQVECFFDGDSAGQKAALRFLPLALKAGLEARFLTLRGETKVDPDLLFLEKGLAGYEAVRADAQSAMAFACRAVLPEPGQANAEAKMRAGRALFDILAAAESEVARSQFLQEAARHLGLSPTALGSDFRQWLQGRGRPADAPEASPSSVRMTQDISAEHNILLLALNFPAVRDRLTQNPVPHELIDDSRIEGRVLNRVLGMLENSAWDGVENLGEHLEGEEERGYVASLLMENSSPEELDRTLDQALGKLELRSAREALAKVDLSLANGSENFESLAFRAKLLARISRINTKLLGLSS